MNNSSVVIPGSPAGSAAAFDMTSLILLVPFIAFAVLIKWGLVKRSRRSKALELSYYLVGAELLLFLLLPVCSDSSNCLLWAFFPIVMFGALIAYMRYWAVKDIRHKQRVLSAVSAGHMKATEVLDYGAGAELKKTGGLKGKSKASLKLDSITNKISVLKPKFKSPKRHETKQYVSALETRVEEPTVLKDEPKEWPKQTTVKQPWWARPLEEEKPTHSRAANPRHEHKPERAGGLQHLKETGLEKLASPSKTLQSNQRIKTEFAKREAEKPAKMPKWLTQLQKEEREKAKEFADKEAAQSGKKSKGAAESHGAGAKTLEPRKEPEPDHEKINGMIDEVLSKRKKPEAGEEGQSTS